MPIDTSALLDKVQDDLVPAVEAYVADQSDANLTTLIFKIVDILITVLRGYV